MFGFFKKNKTKEENEVKKVIQQYGIGYASKLFAEVMNDQCKPSRELAKQFVLEELDAARQGNQKSIEFAKNSGFVDSEFNGAMQQSQWGDDHELEQLQGFFRAITWQVMDDTDLLVQLSLTIVDEFMKIHSLGKYH